MRTLEYEQTSDVMEPSGDTYTAALNMLLPYLLSWRTRLAAAAKATPPPQPLLQQVRDMSIAYIRALMCVLPLIPLLVHLLGVLLVLQLVLLFGLLLWPHDHFSCYSQDGGLSIAGINGQYLCLDLPPPQPPHQQVRDIDMVTLA